MPGGERGGVKRVRRVRARLPRISPMSATPAAPSLDAPTTGARVVPDKPALEGLEDKWSATWKADDTYAFVRPQGDPARDPQQGVQHRHPAADGVGVAARGTRVLLHPHRPDRPLPADARPARVLPDRLGRQRAADRAPGAELLRGALRPERAVRRRLHPARPSRTRSARWASAAATSWSCATSSPTSTRRRSRTCGGGWGCR